ncbi:MAG: STIV orfB116 family protein [Gammaproteobacteria bacterium]
MNTFVLNTPILTDYGTWSFEGPLGINEAKKILSAGFVSAIGHRASAAFLSQLLSIEIPENRLQVKMLSGDRALIFRLLNRLPEGKVLELNEIRTVDFELGLLSRLK